MIGGPPVTKLFLIPLVSGCGELIRLDRAIYSVHWLAAYSLGSL